MGFDFDGHPLSPHDIELVDELPRIARSARARMLVPTVGGGPRDDAGRQRDGRIARTVCLLGRCRFGARGRRRGPVAPGPRSHHPRAGARRGPHDECVRVGRVETHAKSRLRLVGRIVGQRRSSWVQKRRVEISKTVTAYRDDRDASGGQRHRRPRLFSFAQAALKNGSHLREAHGGQRVVYGHESRVERPPAPLGNGACHRGRRTDQCNEGAELQEAPNARHQATAHRSTRSRPSRAANVPAAQVCR